MGDTHTSCEPPFWKDLSVLFKHFSLEYKPTCKHYIWNFIARLSLLSLFMGMIASVVAGLSALFVIVLFGVITAFVIIGTSPHALKHESHHESRHPSHEMTAEESRRASQHDSEHPHVYDTKSDKSYHSLPYITKVHPKEHFVNGGSSQGSVQPSGVVEVDAFPYAGPALPDYTPPTSRNLFMNVLLDEIKYNPGRPEAAPVSNGDVKQTMDDYFRVQWFSDPTDVFGKNQSQRQFVTQPSTTVPNDQGAFANWLYKIPGKTCKEGGRDACLAGTDGGAIPWLNQAS